jgi:hypothetical protein
MTGRVREGDIAAAPRLLLRESMASTETHSLSHPLMQVFSAALMNGTESRPPASTEGELPLVPSTGS